jgi:hypothetical protein
MPRAIVNINEQIVNTAFHNIIENTFLVFQYLFVNTYGVSLTTPLPQIPQTEVGCNISRFGHSNQYQVQFRQWKNKWELNVGHGRKIPGTSPKYVFSIKIPQNAFIRMEFYFEKYDSDYALTCTFIIANPNLPSEKECHTREERVGFVIGRLDQISFDEIRAELEKLATTESYVYLNPIVETPLEHVPSESLPF